MSVLENCMFESEICCTKYHLSLIKTILVDEKSRTNSFKLSISFKLAKFVS